MFRGSARGALARSNARFFVAGYTLIELEDVGHFVQREDPSAVIAAITAHLEATRG
ncbi:MAG: hypothetical protein K0S37_3054 [Microbacterium sp.]|nr:hypothetical protein [Microbacterium sp.]